MRKQGNLNGVPETAGKIIVSYWRPPGKLMPEVALMQLEMATIMMVLASLGVVGGFAHAQTGKKAKKKIAELSSAIAGLKGQIEYENCKLSNLTKSHIQNALKQYSLAVKMTAANDHSRSLAAAEAGLIEIGFVKKLVAADVAENVLGEGNCLEIESATPVNFPSTVKPVDKMPPTKITVMPISNKLTPKHIQELLETLGVPLDDDLSRAFQFFDEPGASSIGQEANSLFSFNMEVTTSTNKKTKSSLKSVFKSVRKTSIRKNSKRNP